VGKKKATDRGTEFFERNKHDAVVRAGCIRKHGSHEHNRAHHKANLIWPSTSNALAFEANTVHTLLLQFFDRSQIFERLRAKTHPRRAKLARRCALDAKRQARTTTVKYKIQTTDTEIQKS